MKYLIILMVFLGSTTLYSSEYNVDKSAKNSVKFISDAPIEEFEGVTKEIDGYLLGDKNDPAKGSELFFQVELGTLDTGIGLRNRHMRENYLHTDKYPLAEYTGKIVSSTKKANGFDVVVDGVMKIHGKEKKLKINGEMLRKGNGFNVKSKFTVKLSDHNIEVPSLMVTKIDENMQLILDFYVVNVD